MAPEAILLITACHKITLCYYADEESNLIRFKDLDEKQYTLALQTLLRGVSNVLQMTLSSSVC